MLSLPRSPAGQTLGILGGGQLGRMLALAARPLGVRTVVVDPSPACAAASCADEHVLGAFTDAGLIGALAARCDALTIEIEHINAAALAEATAAGAVVEPRPATISLLQDKLLQKTALAQGGVRCGAFAGVGSAEELAALAGRWGYPIMLKARRLAYDGRGNAVVRGPEDIAAAWAGLARMGELYAEAWVPFVRELAVMVARGRDGTTRAYPAAQTVQRDSICHLVLMPAPVPGDVRAAAERLACEAVGHLGGAGVFGVELFELADGACGGAGAS